VCCVGLLGRQSWSSPKITKWWCCNFTEPLPFSRQRDSYRFWWKQWKTWRKRYILVMRNKLQCCFFTALICIWCSRRQLL